MVVKKDQQYTFVQIILPKKLFEETFLTGFLLRNNESSNFIRKLWWKEGDRSGEYIPDSEISVETIKLPNNRELKIIELPEVTEEFESKYVGIVLDYVKFTPFFIKSIRYFTPMFVFDETSNRYVWLLSEIIASDEDFKIETKSCDLILDGSKESLINWVRNNIDHKPLWKTFENPEIEQIKKIEDIWGKLDYVWVDDTFLTYLWDSYIDLDKEFREIINLLEKSNILTKELLTDLSNEIDKLIKFGHKTALYVGFLYPGLNINQISEQEFLEQNQIKIILQVSRLIIIYLSLIVIKLNPVSTKSKEDIQSIGTRISNKYLDFLIRSYKFGTEAILVPEGNGKKRLFIKS